jgi:phage FluMu protein Com
VAQRTMRELEQGEMPFDGGTAVQENPDRPVFRGNASDDWLCAVCGNVLAVAMDTDYMTKKVRIRCGRCSAVNVSAEVPVTPARRPR